ncbi:MAG: ACT domain-containing protein [Ignavibacteria bacterium]|nr:MAG: ACT domain-containing protein [Ignavibacteria bacterium]KAF0159149.1 MAG: ACT domain-containing protein [Ignavibacteria bacterium]
MNFTENDIRRITFETINELGSNAAPDVVKEAVRKKVEASTTAPFDAVKKDSISGRVILTSFGLNKPGIVAAITTALGNANCDIQDLSQKILVDFFTMIMIVDITNSKKDLKEIQEEMYKTAASLNIKIYLQHEDVFRYMHRV